ncbi:uncharacterized protein SPPG_06219 [Spizellomyces punctatus DAOM BR117]|uniref:Tail specific protease domain-containing protein n=1 Tax=Spizellomyces punctatus (strain DAOM BR117) TaxID=645134 RepID=A0A0L0HC67_SPIPD|nr:uncharacterized protein SPPG_06219 [Spizellomyces punctatus DAOM BR117]KNC98526.1 hypothetical protein SPPG_06219 [Spizellomyces punctatus DAOM BR117]|eukprot:XP_016606566.1 hypothetical protein SPPG_06219 [Spizellomyces punctatus DAOM BR117]
MCIKRSINPKARRADACSFSPSTIYSYSRVLSCYKSFPFRADIKQDALAKLEKWLDIYAFTDLAKEGSALYGQPGVDLRKGLRDIAARKYDTDFAFQMDLQNLFWRLNDAHTLYKPQCYTQAFYFIQPFAFIPSSDEKLTVTEPWWLAPFTIYNSSTYQEHLDRFGRRYQDWRVLRIDGTDAFYALRKYAENEGGVLRDAEARFIQAVNTGPPNMPTFIFRMDAPPMSPSTLYTLQDPRTGKVEEIEVPWLAVCGSETAITSGADYWLQFCDPKTPVPHVEVPSYEPPSTHQHKNGHGITHPRLSARDESNEEFNFSLPTVQEFLADNTRGVVNPVTLAVQLDKQTWGLHISTFDGSVDDILKWGDDWLNLLNLAKNNSLKNLILDFCGNGGGKILSGSALTFFLNPSEYAPPSGGLPLTPTTLKLIGEATNSSSYFYKNFFSDLNGKNMTLADMWMPTWDRPPGTFVPRSRKMYMREVLLPRNNEEIRSVAPKEKYFNLAIVTDGYCISTCAIVTNQLRAQNTPIYTFTPFPNRVDQKFSYSTHPASVLDSTSFLSPSAPGNFSTTAQVRAAWFELYDGRGEIAEFSRYASDGSIYVPAAKSREERIVTQMEAWRERPEKVGYQVKV